MRYEECKDISNAPQKGFLLAYTRDKVVFERYETLTYVESCLRNKELLELHLFDDNKEYRAIYSSSYNAAIESVCEEKDCDKDEIYSVDIYLDGKYQTVSPNNMITIVNILQYNEDGALSVVDYRLKVGGGM